MRDPVLTSRGVIWVLACGLLVALPYFRHLPAWLLLVFLGMAAWRLLILQGRLRMPGSTLRLLVGVSMLLLVWREYGTVLGRDPGLSLLLIMLGAKFIELRQLRDATLSVIICFMLLLGHFLFDQGIWQLAYLLAVVALCTLALFRLNHPQVELRSGLRLVAMLMLISVPLTLTLYVFFPRLPGGFFGLGTGGEGRAGFSPQMRPGLISRVAQNDAVAFRARFEGDMPVPHQRYWRGRVLWDTDGLNWQPGDAGLDSTWSLASASATVDYELWLEPAISGYLFALDLPVVLPVGAVAQNGFTGTFSSNNGERRRVKLRSAMQYRTGGLSRAEAIRGLRLPAVGERVRALAQQWRDDSGGDANNIVARALAYFSKESFYYTLEPPLLGRDPVDEFLFESRRGFCEHYTAAFVTLMRAAGVPARAVVGYQGGDLNEDSGYFIVRQADAHAWAEVWISDSGWTRVDPTGAVAPIRIEQGIDAIRELERRGLATRGLSPGVLQQALRSSWLKSTLRSLRLQWDALNLAWYRWTLDFSPEKQAELIRKLGQELPMWLTRLAGLAGTLLLLFALFVLIRQQRRQSVDQVQKVWSRFCRKLASAGYPREVWEGPVDYAARLSTQPNLPVGDIERIVNLYIGLRYGTAPAREVASLRANVKKFRTNRQ